MRYKCEVISAGWVEMGKKKKNEWMNEFHIAFPTTASETSDLVNDPYKRNKLGPFAWERREIDVDAFCLTRGGISVGGVVMEPLLEQHLQIETNSSGRLAFGPLFLSCFRSTSSDGEDRGQKLSPHCLSFTRGVK